MKKALVWFYILAFYALCQLIAWGYTFVKYVPERKGMIIGEGMIFLAIFTLAVIRLKRHLEKERHYNQQQNNFLLSVTHELKSPLASVKLYLQTILKRDLDPEKQKVFLGNSLKDIERLDYLVENVLLATKLENRSFNFPMEVFDISELANSVVERLQINACKSQQHIVSEIEDRVKLRADKFAITNVISNLVENAVKYSPKRAEIFVALKKVDNFIKFSVTDNGEGIPDEEKKLIFNKFYRIGNESVRKTKGTGLGLYIVKTILQKHRASITVKDNEPQGTVFEVIFNENAE